MILTKEEIRQIVAQRKQTLTDTQTPSQRIIERLTTLREMSTANIIMTYVDFGKEARTVPMIAELLQKNRQVVVPYCEHNEIRLFLLKNLNELAPGYFGILEPKIELRGLSKHKIRAEELQVIIVPGIAFDSNGGRLGRGVGYYDRFLRKLPETVTTIGLSFDCQIFDKVPMQENDCFLKIIVSETKTFYAKNVMTS
ncbi:MAG: 5-formyltetrahydrofolate cyclo-ligase [Planctomycetaceae bacterium]|jgi:5-formyltetrahydrofolate cyclo-ligase|nr:5-formyltetrahydrofolate cyclo-ligase [Planctomycetaceae bacterium]